MDSTERVPSRSSPAPTGRDSHSLGRSAAQAQDPETPTRIQSSPSPVRLGWAQAKLSRAGVRVKIPRDRLDKTTCPVPHDLLPSPLAGEGPGVRGPRDRCVPFVSRPAVSDLGPWTRRNVSRPVWRTSPDPDHCSRKCPDRTSTVRSRLTRGAAALPLVFPPSWWWGSLSPLCENGSPPPAGTVFDHPRGFSPHRAANRASVRTGLREPPNQPPKRDWVLLGVLGVLGVFAVQISSIRVPSH